MKFPRIMAAVRPDSPLRLTAYYVIFGSLWIFCSDWLVAWNLNQNFAVWRQDLFKDLLFIDATGCMLFILVKRLVVRHRVAEEERWVSQERLALALKSANQGLYDLNVQTGETVVNDTYATMLGYDPVRFRETNTAWRERLHPDDREKVYQVYSDYIAGRLGEYRVEFRQKTATGDWRWVLSMGRVVAHDEQGRPLRMLGTHTDITALKSIEARNADALALVKAILQSSPVGIVAYGPEGRAAVANQAAAQLIGTDVPGLLRQNFRELESWRRYGLLAAAEDALASGHEVVVRGPIRTTFGRSLHVETRFMPFEHQGCRHLLVIFNDQTALHGNLENLRLMHAAVNAAPVGWVMTDAQGTIQWVNQGFTKLTGYTAEETIGRNPRVLKSGRHPPEFYANLWATIRRGEAWSGEILNQRKDGGLYHEFMTVVPIPGETGEIGHFVAIKQDISERKNLEAQLARAQRLESIGMLASGIAHDLNNIFAPILLSLELLKLKYPKADAKKTLEMIEGAGQRGAGIVRQILTFARGVEGERIEVQPKYLVKEAAQILGETLPRNIRVETELEAVLPPVLGDATQLHQVMLNLAINARDAMPAGGRLVLGAQVVQVEEARAHRNPPLRPGPCVAFTVADTGSGIPPEVLEHMFEPFYTTKPLGKGTGLGLSTVYGIVRSHGGAVEVDSKLNVGTIFTVLIPALDAPAEGSRAPLVADTPFQGNGRRVLVVDDEESIRLITLHALQHHGFTVEVASDGVEGLERFRTDPTRFALVITDLMMPRMGGRKLAQEIRRLAPSLPIIASSGLSEEGTSPASGELSLAALGVPTLLRKPYTEAELLAAMQHEMEPGAMAQKKD